MRNGEDITEAMLPEFELPQAAARKVRAWAALSDRAGGMPPEKVTRRYGFTAAELDEYEPSWRAVQRGERHD